MWGDAEGAYSLSPTDKLSKSLLQVSGPTHVPYHDSKWQQLLLNYEQLVHLHNLRLAPEDTSENGAAEVDDNVVGKACRRCAKHCTTSSNLAALSLHVARMIKDLQGSISELTTAYHQKYQQYEYVDETNLTGVKHGGELTKLRIVLIGKARATCGAINVLRLFAHETIVQACREDNVAEKSTLYYEGQSASKQDVNYILRESFTYRSRDLNNGMDSQIDGQDAALDLIASIMPFLSNWGKLMSTEGGKTGDSSQNFDSLSIPEVYDVVLQILSLLLVLLSTQLYQPMISSAQLAEVGQTTSNHYFLERIMDYAFWQRQNSRQSRRDGVENLNGSAQGKTNLDNDALLLLNSCFHWMIHRPQPPKRSIASHYLELTHSIAHQLPNMAIAQDGMYENHSIVMSTSPTGATSKDHMQSSLVGAASQGLGKTGLNEQQASSSTAIALGTDDQVGISSPGHVAGTIATRTSAKLLIPIRSILLLSSSLFLLPIRLVKLAFRVLGHGGQRALLASKHSDISSSDHAALQHLQSYCEKASGWDSTNNILWISDSPVADLSSALILLLSNNFRANLESGSARQRSLVTQNPFRSEMATLSDSRWSGDVPNSEHAASLFPSDSPSNTVFSADFESLFDAFGRITHTEVGALMLYTVMQSSPIFAAALMARSDLDCVLMPLLRTLYFSSKLAHEASHGQVSPFITLAQKDRPFRAQSQLYIILILMLIFSQDPSVGRHVFRRVSIPKVAWYKERQLKDISLGSMVILVLVKAITFNLNRLQDEFLLSNCIAVLLNLSPHIVNIHPYVSSRLVSVTVSCFKRYSALVEENNGQVEEEGDMSTMQGMHGETCRTLLQLIKHSTRPKCLETNLDLVYSILLEEAAFQTICSYAPLKQLDTTSISALMSRANYIIQNHGGSTSAEETMNAMKASNEWKSYLDSLPRARTNSFDSLSSDASDIGNLTYQYEEESDPEIFFVPYIWDVIVGSLTASTFEWARDRIKAFPLNHPISDYEGNGLANTSSNHEDEHIHTQEVV